MRRRKNPSLVAWRDMHLHKRRVTKSLLIFGGTLLLILLAEATTSLRSNNQTASPQPLPSLASPPPSSQQAKITKYEHAPPAISLDGKFVATLTMMTYETGKKTLLDQQYRTGE